ncbi:MAG TPA: hypothetical protein VKX17_22585 [Planctomycetota bacterium]|nr:hypothetical protein [Planctomycetota bacterium]
MNGSAGRKSAFMELVSDAAKAIFEFQTFFILPQNYNDCVPIPDSVLEEMFSQVIKEYRGLTILPGKGYWTNPKNKKVVSEPILYCVVKIQKQSVEKLEQMLIAFGQKLRQEDVYIADPIRGARCVRCAQAPEADTWNSIPSFELKSENRRENLKNEVVYTRESAA